MCVLSAIARDWCPVSYNGASGWVNPLYLAAEPAWPRVSWKSRRARGASASERLRRRGAARGRKRARLPSYWQVTGVAEGESLKVHDGPSPAASVVHAFEPQTGCIKLAGGCQKPWCQVKFAGLSGERVGWVDSKHLAPSETTCSN